MYLQTLSWRSRYFVGERPSQPDMIWWMVSFSTRQILHVLSSSTLKTCFSIYLVEIACSWMAAIVDSVDLFRVEDFKPLVGSLFVEMRLVKVSCKLPKHMLSFEFRPQFVDTCGSDGDFPRQFPHGSQLLNIMANFITISLYLLMDRFFSSGYLSV